MRVGDRVLAVGGRRYGTERVNFRDLFFVFEGKAGTDVAVTWKPGGAAEEKTSLLRREPEEPGDTLVWKSARVITRGGKKYGYLRLWGMSAETALAAVDLLLDRDESARAKPELAGWASIEGVLLDVRANSGGYDPNILTTFLRGQWSAGDYEVVTRDGRRLVASGLSPAARGAPRQLRHGERGRGARAEVPRARDRPDRGGDDGGDALGRRRGRRGSRTARRSVISRRAIRDRDGNSYEGRGVAPDVAVPDRPPAAPGQEDAIVEAGIRALAGRDSK